VSSEASPIGRRRRCARTVRCVSLAGLIALPATLAATGCGLGAGKPPSAVHLTVTRDFGASVVRAWSAPRVRGAETVMSLLMRNAGVGTRYGGGFVQSIDGLAGGQDAGQPVDWFYYVNGVWASTGAASRNVDPGDRIWWDRHDWSQTDRIPAVVGSFPEPFLNGLEGKRLPVRVECAEVTGRACKTVRARLRAAGVTAGVAAIGSGVAASQTVRVAVGPWRDLGGDPAVAPIGKGPRASGVYARIAENGSTLTLLDQDGRVGRTLLAGAGLIAATRTGEDAPKWVVTGTDDAGVERAAQDFSEGELRDRFALAVTPQGAPLSIPLVAR
jgi:uncharacterized protein DUF4430